MSYVCTYVTQHYYVHVIMYFGIVFIYVRTYVHVMYVFVVKYVIADIQLLLASSANGEWQTVILQDWIEHWSVVCVKPEQLIELIDKS